MTLPLVYPAQRSCTSRLDGRAHAAGLEQGATQGGTMAHVAAHTSFRLPESQVGRLDRVARALSRRHGLPFTRTAALRLDLARGLPALEAELSQGEP